MHPFLFVILQPVLSKTRTSELLPNSEKRHVVKTKFCCGWCCSSADHRMVWSSQLFQESLNGAKHSPYSAKKWFGLVQNVGWQNSQNRVWFVSFCRTDFAEQRNHTQCNVFLLRFVSCSLPALSPGLQNPGGVFGSCGRHLHSSSSLVNLHAASNIFGSICD